MQSYSPSFLQSSRVRHAAVLGEDRITIYYIGGVIPYGPANPAGTSFTYIRAPMDQIITFNTSDLTWDTWNTSSEVTPTPRSGHTVTLSMTLL